MLLILFMFCFVSKQGFVQELGARPASAIRSVGTRGERDHALLVLNFG